MDENRILDRLDDIGERMARVETSVEGLSVRIDKYNDVTSRTLKLELELSSLRNNCAQVQADKKDNAKRRSIPWGAIIGSITSGITVGLIMLGFSNLFR